MGFTLLTLPRDTNLINKSVSAPNNSTYTPSSRIVGTGVNYTTTLAKQVPVYTQQPGSSGNNQVPSQPIDTDCDPEIYLEQKHLMFENLLKYMDEYSTYNYLKVSNPYYKDSFLSSDIIVPLEINMVTSIENLFYFRLFPDDSNICADKLELVRAKLEAKDYSLELEVCGCTD